MLSHVEKNILSTLCYSDIFDYPLTAMEIEQYFISRISGPKAHRPLDENLESLVKKNKIIFSNGFYCLAGKQKIIQLRKQKEKISQAKLLIAGKVGKILHYIPTIKLVGISGSLAMRNAGDKDDIDIFIITQKKTLWLTRIMSLLILEIMRLRRPKNIINASNKVCLNMLMDETELLLPKNKQNIFTAHEIVQMKPIFAQNNIYNIFLKSNMWVKNYLPNAQSRHSGLDPESFQDGKLLRFFLSPLELLAKKFQLFFINKNKTTEIVTDTLLAFHPRDNTPRVIANYNKRLKRYNI